MLIRKSTELDFDRIMEIYKHARKYMAEHGNPNQWGHLRIDTHGDNNVMQKLPGSWDLFIVERFMWKKIIIRDWLLRKQEFEENICYETIYC